MTTAAGNVSHVLNSSPHTLVSAEQPWIDTKCKHLFWTFLPQRISALNSDIEVQSSDGFIFQLHRLLLEANTGAFPGSEFDTQGEIVQLTEPAEVLSVLLAFIYPKKFTNLAKHGFELVAAIAEAAEKYEVFPAMYTCSVRLAKFLPAHAPEIFMYAVKHDYPEIVSEAVPYFARSPFTSVLAKFPPAYVVPWSLYREAWSSVFKDAIKVIKKLELTTQSSCHRSNYPYGPTLELCGTCQTSLYRLFTALEEIDTVSALKETLKSPRSKYSDLKCCEDSSSYNSSKCPYMGIMTEQCRSKIEKIPDFLSFVNSKVEG
ncbi:hypothetical protein CPB84DRAFT_1846315 [Gymnopilus junonius]|uniref:BTB domain-containing protein n=1 Tax=Gymnopilus junonius TaxID=109634 RepID=A0A9P5NPS1_GYMJU|nr:hypothetical protein CPB84DRAFT_1846315 [Gymnopilus junonius]